MTLSIFAVLALVSAPGPADSLRAVILSRVARDSGATVAVVLRDPVNGFMVLLNPDLRFHAASTMKVPVLMALGRQADAGTLAWDDSVVVVNRFVSIVDGSAYELDAAEDSDSTNNILFASVVMPESATRMIRTLGADSMLVLRGVEDGKAYDRGLNNTTTARDLSTLGEAIDHP